MTILEHLQSIWRNGLIEWARIRLMNRRLRKAYEEMTWDDTP